VVFAWFVLISWNLYAFDYCVCFSTNSQSVTSHTHLHQHLILLFSRLFWTFLKTYVVGYVDRLAKLISKLGPANEALPSWEHNLLYEALLPFFETFFKEYYNDDDLRQHWAPYSKDPNFIDPLAVLNTLAKNYQDLVKAAIDVNIDIPRHCKAIKDTADAMFARISGITNNAIQLTVTADSKTPRTCL